MAKTARGIAKSTGILTTKGWKKVEKIKKGDSVLGSDGLWREIEKVSKHNTKGDIIALTTEHGTSRMGAGTPIHVKSIQKKAKSKEEAISVGQLMKMDMVVAFLMLDDIRPIPGDSWVLKVKKEKYNGQLYDITIRDGDSLMTRAAIVYV